MSLDIKVGSRSITSIGPMKDLASNVKSDFQLGPEIESQLDKSLSTLPANLRSVSIAFSGGPSWQAGDFAFSLSAGVTGKLSVLLAGDDLLSYADTFETDISIGRKVDTDPPVTLTVPDGAAYVWVELDFQISGGISAAARVGAVGVFASVDAQDTFGVDFYKKCSLTDTLHDAIGAAFTNFVLPLHPLTFTNLEVGDYLHHDFNAGLQVGLGARIGLQKTLYAGQAAADLHHSASVFKMDRAFIPSLEASASLAFQFTYAGTFEALLWKDNATTGNMHLYRSKTQDTRLTLHAGISLVSQPEVSAATMTGQVGTLFGRMLPGSLGSVFMSKVLPKATDEVTNFAEEGQEKIAGWLKPINDAKATLDLAIETTKQTFLLLDYTFDLTASAFPDAWKTAVAGDFVAALRTPNGGVSIAAGGGMEKFYSKKTSIRLNHFGQLQTAWSDAIISNSSLIYAGNNTFHLAANVGRQLIYQVGGSKREIDFYFAAEADLTTETLQLKDIDLQCILQARNNPRFGNYVSSFLGLVTSGMNTDALVQSVKALAAQPNTTERLHLIFNEDAYVRLQSSTITKGKPDDQTSDQQNYAAFANACSNLFSSPPANFSYNGQRLGYAIWSNWNIACNDKWPPSPGALPDRTQSGNPAAGVAYLNLEFPQAGTNAALIGYALQAASDFMNLCADLKSLATITIAGPRLDPWDKLVARLLSIMKNDVSPDFVSPVALALTRLCAGGGPPNGIGGPAPGRTDTNTISVTLTY